MLACAVPRDAADEAIAAAGKGAKRSDGKLPPHVMVYFAMAMAMAMFAEEDYEEVAARLTETLVNAQHFLVARVHAARSVQEKQAAGLG